MEDSSLKQTTMVSRLPKFGSRGPSAAAPLHNGSVLVASSGWHKVVPLGKQNGMVPIPSSLSAKGKKMGGEGKPPDSGEDAREARGILRPQAQLRPPATIKQLKKPSAGTAAKAQRSTATSTFPKIASQSTKANPRPKQAAGKPGVNGVASGRGSSSSESLKSLSVDTVVRSQSFTYLKSPATTTDPPLTRSFSFNRAAELAKELPRPLSESPIARSPVTQPRLALDGNDEGPFGGASNTPSFPTSALKKSLLPSYGGYKLACPSLIKQPRPIRPSKVQVKEELSDRDGDSPLSDPYYKLTSNPESADTTPEEPSKEDGVRGTFLDVLEDMSMSSTSSLGHNDISEEYMDDFDDLGNGAGILLMPVHEGERGQLGMIDGFVSQRSDGSTVSSLHSFASEMVDWAEMGLTGGRKGTVGSHRRASRPLSAGRDLAHGSSLDLSPSDSSGGTYMWDEEVLEPLGPGAQLCRSYDSNLNSMDILNNLENLDSCDLEDDDLMLDVDLPEDASLRSDVSGVSRYDRSDAEFWPWRKRQQRGRKERLREDDGDGVEDVPALSRSASGPMAVDELILKHMTQDCCSVKEQLLQLRRLLQVDEDDDAEDVVSSPSDEDQSYQQQVEELLKEVQTLREELRLKEKLIVTLMQNMRPPLEVTPCRCQQEDLEGALQRREHQDKGTQTTWRVQNPQILQPSRASASGHRKLARPSSQALSGAPSDHVDTQSGDCPVRPQSCTPPVLPVSAADHSARPSSVPSTAPVTAATSPCRALNSHDLVPHVNNHLRTDDSHCADARLKNCASESMRHPGTLSKPLSLGSGTVAMPRTRLLPPPKRALPCINPGVRMNSENGSVRALPCNSRLPKPKSH